MGFGAAVSSGLSKYAGFSGRARRSEFWWFYLFSFLVIVAAAIVDAVAGTSPLFYALAALALFLPNLAAAVRRLHDIGKSGWSYLIVLIPIVGGIILIVWLAKDGVRGQNEYGPDPKGGGTDQYGFDPAAATS